MKYIIATIFALGMLAGKSQEIKKTHKVVLRKDSIRIFDKQYAPIQFSESYFVCKEDFNYSFTVQAFESLVARLKAQSPDIEAFRSADNKSLVCIFPKLSTRNIAELHDFIAKNLDESVMSQANTRQTVHVQVVEEYDPHNTATEKGFSYN